MIQKPLILEVSLLLYKIFSFDFRQTCDICGFVSTSTDPSAMKVGQKFNFLRYLFV